MTSGVILRLTVEDVWVRTAEKASKLIATGVFSRLATEDICGLTAGTLLMLTAEKTSELTVIVIYWLITERICELTARIVSRLTAELTGGIISRVITAGIC